MSKPSTVIPFPIIKDAPILKSVPKTDRKVYPTVKGVGFICILFTLALTSVALYGLYVLSTYLFDF